LTEGLGAAWLGARRDDHDPCLQLPSGHGSTTTGQRALRATTLSCKLTEDGMQLNPTADGARFIATPMMRRVRQSDNRNPPWWLTKTAGPNVAEARWPKQRRRLRNSATRPQRRGPKRVHCQRCRSVRALIDAAFAAPNVRGNRPAKAGSVRLVCDSAEGTAHEPYAACRSGSG
jgi:hypothetical protein